MSWLLAAGQLGSISQIESMCVHNGKIYAGTKSADQSGDGGQLLEWDGVSQWVSVASMNNTANAILSLASFNGDIYATTGIFGSGTLTADGGRLLKWNGVNAWIVIAPQLYNQFYIWDLTVWNNRLWVGTFDRMYLYSWGLGETVWTLEAFQSYPPPQQFAQALQVYNGNMMMAGVVYGILFQFNPGTNAWDLKAPSPGTAIYGLHSGDLGAGEKLFGIGTDTGKILQWDDVSSWVTVDTILDFLWEAVFQGGKMYICARQVSGRLYMFDGINPSTVVATQYSTEQDIRRIISFNGKIYGGTGNNGLLLEYSPPNPVITLNSIVSLEAIGLPVVVRTVNVQSALPPATKDKEGDIRLTLNVYDGYVDMLLDDRDVERDAGFETSVLITLLTNKRADNNDKLPDDYGEQGGWWGDVVPTVVGDQIGWKGWLLRREKTLASVISRCKEYLIDGFQWMIDDSIIAGFEAKVMRVDNVSDAPNTSVLFIELIFQKPDGQDIYYKFYYNWQAQTFRRGIV